MFDYILTQYIQIHCFQFGNHDLTKQVSGKHNASKSLIMITESTDKRSEKIFQASQREQQYTVIASKLANKIHFNRNCVYMLNNMYDARCNESCARFSKDTWIVWNFVKDTQPRFDNDVWQLGMMFPVYRNVYRVSLIKKNTQNFLKCDCLHYERCGIPCNHILQITDKIEDNMVKIQHWKVYNTHFGDDSTLGTRLMDAQSLQQNNESNGVPITTSLLRSIMSPIFG